MKYIDAEQLKEEIQANLAAISFNDDYQEGYEACGMSVLKFIDSLQQEQQESPSLVEKAIVWFNNIAESAKRLSAGNVSHLGPTIAGMAIRSEEFLEKHKQEQPEQPTRGYDEAYLNEKIAKATKSWKGVDVDKFMDEVRGREPDKDLEEEFAHEYAIYHLPTFIIASLVDGTELIDFIHKTARHFYELGLNARKEETK